MFYTTFNFTKLLVYFPCQIEIYQCGLILGGWVGMELYDLLSEFSLENLFYSLSSLEESPIVHSLKKHKFFFQNLNIWSFIVYSWRTFFFNKTISEIGVVLYSWRIHGCVIRRCHQNLLVSSDRLCRMVWVLASQEFPCPEDEGSRNKDGEMDVWAYKDK